MWKSLIAALALSVACLPGCAEPGHGGADDSLEMLAATIRQEDAALRSFALSVREQTIPMYPGSVTFAQMGIEHLELAPRILGVTMDDNENVYFILNSSWVTFNQGFVLRNGESALLGDQQEPRVQVAERLFGDWWFYSAS